MRFILELSVKMAYSWYEGMGFIVNAKLNVAYSWCKGNCGLFLIYE